MPMLIEFSPSNVFIFYVMKYFYDLLVIRRSENKYVNSCTPHFDILDSRPSHLDSACWLGSTLKLHFDATRKNFNTRGRFLRCYGNIGLML